MAVKINPEIHANLAGMSLDEILQAADRWKAMEHVAPVLIDKIGLECFTPPALSAYVRALDESWDHSVMTHTLYVSKLTELADLVRAKTLEDAIEQATHS